MKKVKNIQEEISRRNEIWKAASKKERAVLVAQDVLDRLSDGQIIAEQQIWLNFADTCSYNETVPLQECVLGGEKCNCCAQGALMMGLIGWRNRVDSSSLNRRGALEPGDDGQFNLNDIFSATQQEMIEQAFEDGYGQNGFNWDDDNLDYLEDVDEIKAALKCKNTKSDERNLRIRLFHRSFKTEKDLMRGIMKNIIKNEGVFIP